MTLDPATRLPECSEGPKAAAKFDLTMSKLLSVSHEERKRREAEYRKHSLRHTGDGRPRMSAAHIKKGLQHQDVIGLKRLK